MTSRIKDRLESLPQELFIAREQAYESFKAHRDAEERLAEEEALLLQRRPPQGKNAEERKRAATINLSEDGNILHYRNMLRKNADDLADRKRAVKMLEDEFSSLRNLVEIISSQNIKDAAGTGSATSTGAAIAANRKLGAPF